MQRYEEPAITCASYGCQERCADGDNLCPRCAWEADIDSEPEEVLGAHDNEPDLPGSDDPPPAAAAPPAAPVVDPADEEYIGLMMMSHSYESHERFFQMLGERYRTAQCDVVRQALYRGAEERLRELGLTDPLRIRYEDWLYDNRI